VGSLLYTAYSGQVAHSQLTDPTTVPLPWEHLLVTLLVWVVVLLLVDSIPPRRLKPRNIEEPRPM
jgi:hypothetical protein